MEKIMLTKEEFKTLKLITCDIDPATLKELNIHKSTISDIKGIFNKYFIAPGDDVELPQADGNVYSSTNGVDVGETFTVIVDGEPHMCTLVAQDCPNTKTKVSVHSALGKAVLGKCEGETFMYEEGTTKHYCRVASVDNKSF